MATTRSAASSGLSTTDIEGIRTNLAAGRKPKVMFTESAGQIAGQVGQIVQLTDPDQSDEWLVVRFGRDELPFSPADLTVPPRGRSGGKRVEPEKSATKEPAKATAAARSTPAAKTAPVTKRGAAERSSGASDVVGATAAAAPAAESAPPVPAPREAAPADSPRPAKRATRSARSTKPKPPAAMTVTLAYEAGEWTVAAHQGSKTLAKPYVIRPAEALKMVAMLDVPGVHDAVEQIVTAEVTEAQRRADTLRSELAEVEARLAELRDAG
jgi:hypothetical protein